MKTLLCCAALLAAAPSAGYAANARNPYGNVNHANDAGNDTGDSRVDALNQAQLNGNGVAAPNVAPGTVYVPTPYAYAPPVAYAYPPPVYYPPVYVAPRPYRYYRYGW
jgi:hypothetical protein